MTKQARLIAVIGTVVLTCSLGVAMAESHEGDTVHVDSEKAEFVEVVPGVQKRVLWGDHEAGPYGAFTRFDPGQVNPLHTHTNEIRIVVLEGAYVYQPQGGEEIRVTAGSYLSTPGGTVHVSGGDAEEGALFYESSPSGFDLVPVEE